MLIARVEDKYVFLTNEEKEIENEIRNVEVDFSAINKKLASIIFDDILKTANTDTQRISRISTSVAS